MRRSSHFDYSSTCPLIDGQLNKIEIDIYNNVKNLLEEMCPHLTTESLDQYTKEWTDIFYYAVEPHVEQVRMINSDMRTAADEQITTLTENLEYAQSELDDKTKEVESLEKEVEAWKYDYETRKNEKSSLHIFNHNVSFVYSVWESVLS